LRILKTSLKSPLNLRVSVYGWSGHYNRCIVHTLANVYTVDMLGMGPYKPRTGHIGQCMNHALVILAGPAVYCIRGRDVLYTKQGMGVARISRRGVCLSSLSSPPLAALPSPSLEVGRLNPASGSGGGKLPWQGQLPVSLSHGQLVTRSCHHTVNSSHTCLIIQSVRHKRAHNKVTSRKIFYLHAGQQPETVLSADGIIMASERTTGPR